MQRAGQPRPDRAAADRGQHQRAEDRAVVPALEDLGRDRADDRGQAVAEHALRRDHQVQQRRCRRVAQQQQQQEGHGEAKAADRPHELAPDPIGQMAERDLARDAGKADAAQAPRRRVPG